MLLSGIAYPHSILRKIVAAWRGGKIEVVFSSYILDELQRVLPRLSHRLHWTDRDRHDFIDSLTLLADMVEPTAAVEPMLQDAKDQPVLGTFLAANADYLITGDNDLLVLCQQYLVISPGNFWRLHGE